MNHKNNPSSCLPSVLLTRRRALASVGALSLIAATGTPAHARQGEATPVPAEMDGVEVSMPDWRFSLVDRQDPFDGELTKPDVLPPNTRVVAYQIVLTNMSDQPMEFTLSDIRIRDIDGVEYRAGEYQGTEPRIVSQNLPDGERTRGWVWFGVPEDVEVTSIVFVAPPPVLRIDIE